MAHLSFSRWQFYHIDVKLSLNALFNLTIIWHFNYRVALRRNALPSTRYWFQSVQVVDDSLSIKYLFSILALLCFYYSNLEQILRNHHIIISNQRRPVIGKIKWIVASASGIRLVMLAFLLTICCWISNNDLQLCRFAGEKHWIPNSTWSYWIVSHLINVHGKQK